MPYEVEVSEEFRDWYEPLSEAEQISIERVVLMLMEAGPALGFPYSSGIQNSQFSHMRELRIQHNGRRRIAFCMLLTRTGRHSSFSEGTKPEMIAGTKGWCRRRMPFMQGI